MPLKQGARTTRDPCGEDARSRGNERAGGIRAPGWAGGVPMGRVTGRVASHHTGAAGFQGIACPGWRAQTEHPQRSTHANCRPTLSSCKKQETLPLAMFLCRPLLRKQCAYCLKNKNANLGEELHPLLQSMYSGVNLELKATSSELTQD